MGGKSAGFHDPKKPQVNIHPMNKTVNIGCREFAYTINIRYVIPCFSIMVLTFDFVLNLGLVFDPKRFEYDLFSPQANYSQRSRVGKPPAESPSPVGHDRSQPARNDPEPAPTGRKGRLALSMLGGVRGGSQESKAAEQERSPPSPGINDELVEWARGFKIRTTKEPSIHQPWI